MSNEYQFLFPFELIPKGSRIIIYGAGKMGQEYLQQMQLTHYCEVIAMADRNHAQYQGFAVPVIAPNHIRDYHPDIVVIALRVQNYLNEFLRVLAVQKIPRECIVCGGERQNMPILISPSKDDTSHFAQLHTFDNTAESLLIYCMGGFGDFVIQKKIVETLLALSPKLTIDILCSHGEDFLRFLYADTSQIRSIRLNLGTRYDVLCKQYAASMTMQGNMIVRIDYLNHVSPFPECLKQVFQQLEERDDDVPSLQTPLYIAFYRSIYKGENCYKRMTCGGIIPCKDQQVHIPQDSAAMNWFALTVLRSYVTINYGNGNAKDEKTVSKSWRRDRFEQVIEGLHHAYPGLEVVQVGPDDAVPLKGARNDFFGVSWPCVAEILRHSLLHIDIEGGLVHLASQIGTKCIVLFGPTQIEAYGYANNINLRAGNCHNCYGLYQDINTCARGLSDPECMMSITPEMVLTAARKYLDSVVNFL